MSKPAADYAALAPILALLADGEFHSGRELGQQLGVSRTAVWKHLQKLEQFGLALESAKGRGYRLEGGLELLDQQTVLAHLHGSARASVSELEVFPLIDSTNTRAMTRAAQGQSGYVCLAELQSAGRGRRGRTWVSPFGKNIYLSITWSFDGGAAALEGLSLAVGVVLARVLRDLGIEDIALKWPNDILCHGRKLAGVLLEMTGDPAGVCQVVVGVGLNVAMPPFSEHQIDQPWVDAQTLLAEAGLPPVSRNFLAAALIDELLPLLQNYQNDGFQAYRADWMALDAFAGCQVEVRAADKAVYGLARGVSETGALCLEIEGQRQHFYGGEVSLRAVS